MSIQVFVPVTEPSQPSAARRAAVDLGEQAGLRGQELGTLALVVTELATNLVKHARQGGLFMRRLGIEGTEGVEVLSLDRGPGIQDLSRALGDGFSTAGSPGTGLGAVVRTASAFDIYSQPGTGTAVVVRVRPASAKPADHEVGVVHQPKEGEPVCGDEWIVRWFRDGWVCAVVDGLGHGVLASDAAKVIVSAIRAATNCRHPAALVAAAHEAAKPTRGAALGVAVRNGEEGVVQFAGVGNIAAVVCEGEQRRHLVSYNGIIGHEYRKLSEITHKWSRQALLVMHSDGIGTNWDMARYPGLAARDPSLIAGVLYRDYSRGRDDTTVVVVKERQ